MSKDLQRKRLLSQLIFLLISNLGARFKTGLCYPFLYCHACPYSIAGCPIGIIEHAIYKKHFNLFLLLYPILMIASLSMIIGRAICGWMCPIGSLQRITSTERLTKLSRKIPHSIERFLRYAKYINLILFVFLTPHFLGFMFTDICPIGFLVGTIPLSILYPGRFSPNEFFPFALMVFIAFIILIFLFNRGWCKFFCPVGAFIGLFNKVSLLRIEVDKSKCVHCNACIKVCPMGVDVPNVERSRECILCGRCIDACQYGAISFKVGI